MDKQLPQLLYTPIEVAKLLSISRSQVYNLMNEHRLDSVTIGRSRRISLQQIHDFLNDLIAEKNIEPAATQE